VVACGALAGAVGNMVQYAVETKVEHKGNFSLGGMLGQGAIGAVVGGISGGLGSMAGSAIKAGISSVVSKVGAKAVADAVEPAVAKEASGVASNLGKEAAEKGPAKAAAGATKCHSFTATTAVLMANGTTKAISTIKIGDKVLATDPTTGKKTVRTVEVVHVNHDTKLTDVTITVNGHTTVIHTTQYHPFWDQTKQRWVNASDLTTGDHTQSTTTTTPTVSNIVNYDGTATMYDLTINTVHTYYVIAEGTSVLVHNCDPSDELLDMADANIGGTNVAAEVVTPNGARGFGVSAPRSLGQLTPQVRAAVQATGHHGGCAEIGALCFVELGGNSITGARGQAVKVAGGSKAHPIEEHGEELPFCEYCENLFDYLEGGPM